MVNKRPGWYNCSTPFLLHSIYIYMVLLSILKLKVFMTIKFWWLMKTRQKTNIKMVCKAVILIKTLNKKENKEEMCFIGGLNNTFSWQNCLLLCMFCCGLLLFENVFWRLIYFLFLAENEKRTLRLVLIFKTFPINYFLTFYCVILLSNINKTWNIHL